MTEILCFHGNNSAECSYCRDEAKRPNKLDVCSAAYVWLKACPQSELRNRTFLRLLEAYKPIESDINGDLSNGAQAIADSFDDVDDVINALEDAGVFS